MCAICYNKSLIKLAVVVQFRTTL